MTRDRPACALLAASWVASLALLAPDETVSLVVDAARRWIAHLECRSTVRDATRADMMWWVGRRIERRWGGTMAARGEAAGNSLLHVRSLLRERCLLGFFTRCGPRECPGGKLARAGRFHRLQIRVSRYFLPCASIKAHAFETFLQSRPHTREKTMDPLRLLSRGTKPQRQSGGERTRSRIPSAQDSQPRLFAGPGLSKKRKREREGSLATDENDAVGFDFFAGGLSTSATQPKAKDVYMSRTSLGGKELTEDPQTNGKTGPVLGASKTTSSIDERRQLLKQHKIKATWLNPATTQIESGSQVPIKSDKKQKPQLFPDPLQSFQGLNDRFGVSEKIESNVRLQGYADPTEVQMVALPLLLDPPDQIFGHDRSAFSGLDGHLGIDLLTVAPTGSGKTLAFLLPALSMISTVRRKTGAKNRHTACLILAPTKELAGQIVNEGRKLVENTGIKISQFRKGMQVQSSTNDADEEAASHVGDPSTVMKADILVSTPGLLHGVLETDVSDSTFLPGVQLLVLDEADVLLDPLFRGQTVGIWERLTNTELRVNLWSATMGSNIEDLARSILTNRRTHQMTESDRPLAEAPLIRLVVGLKDSAVPNVQHKLVYSATEQGKLLGLRQLLHPASSIDAGPGMRPPFLVFTQTIERAVALHSELLYDIPPEAGGATRLAVLHAGLSDLARDNVMTRFRKGEVWVLITTDLLSRGVDFRGVNGIVNYDIPTSSAAYVHRVGRTGRAGREGGVAVTLYSKEDIPYLKHVANVVAAAQRQQGSQGEEGVQQWLLDALPSLSKNDKQQLKRHGIAARTSRGTAKDPKAARKSRITTKSGFLRREENKRRGAIEASRRRAAGEVERGQETDFGGFD